MRTNKTEQRKRETRKQHGKTRDRKEENQRKGTFEDKSESPRKKAKGELALPRRHGGEAGCGVAFPITLGESPTLSRGPLVQQAESKRDGWGNTRKASTKKE